MLIKIEVTSLVLKPIGIIYELILLSLYLPLKWCELAVAENFQLPLFAAKR